MEAHAGNVVLLGLLIDFRFCFFTGWISTGLPLSSAPVNDSTSCLICLGLSLSVLLDWRWVLTCLITCFLCLTRIPVKLPTSCTVYHAQRPIGHSLCDDILRMVAIRDVTEVIFLGSNLHRILSHSYLIWMSEDTYSPLFQSNFRGHISHLMWFHQLYITLCHNILCWIQ